ncbi:capsule assembly Wzi family protein [uncultured Draconibacterium sp.]|uniref:capsule assembly Wzi family protein n=1 Tax=uncultured Draconibacterium sp. TaxID=1573823 RepID=UPI002AA76242|nr:capsule assembly Wzi family protein [uncultured Draconibacterium sp.]
MQKIIPVLILWLLPLSAVYAQSVDLGYNTLAGTKNRLPFWLWANQLGHYDPNSSTVQNLELRAFHSRQLSNTDFTVEAGLDLDLLLADNNDLRFTQLFAGLNWKFLQLQIGAFPDEERFAGLSTSNGNLAASRNARPHPRLRLGFNRFIPIIRNWFFIQGFYEEGLLNDKRYVEDTHLHRKALYLRFGHPQSIELTAGLEHFVMWGGTHPKYGELQGWSSYFDYISGSAGDENALPTDQENVLGNGYGVYQVQLKKAWQKFHTTLYISHPFEDRSGMQLDNAIDNLYGIHLAFLNPEALLQNLVLEYINTKNQSGKYHLIPDDNGMLQGHGRDNYYNHGIYQSGVTYNQMAMASPLFAPVIIEDGISKGFENTRFTGFHMGANGLLSKSIYWNTALTYTYNYGLHNEQGESTYNPTRKQASLLGQLNWKPIEKKISIAAALAADQGSLYDNGESITRLGAMLSLNYSIK